MSALSDDLTVRVGADFRRLENGLFVVEFFRRSEPGTATMSRMFDQIGTVAYLDGQPLFIGYKDLKFFVCHGEWMSRPWDRIGTLELRDGKPFYDAQADGIGYIAYGEEETAFGEISLSSEDDDGGIL